MRRHSDVVVFWFWVTAASLGSAPGIAQQPLIHPSEHTIPVEPHWGTVSASAQVIHSHDFEWTYGSQPGSLSNFDRYCMLGDVWCMYIAGVDLPAGAFITAYAIDACDTSADHEVVFIVARKSISGTIFPVSPFFGTTGKAETGGCARYFNTFETPHTVDTAFTYFASVQPDSSSAGAEARFGALRIYYKLQVSPAPAVATFPNDVPTTHPFFRFVEALAAAGLTAGCGPGSYCPDAPVTRGQLAVFLAAALGLHFPN